MITVVAVIVGNRADPETMDDVPLGLSRVVVLDPSPGSRHLDAGAADRPAADRRHGDRHLRSDLVNPSEMLGPALARGSDCGWHHPFRRALSLKREELGSGVRSAVTRPITLGVVITWFVATVSIALLLDVPPRDVDPDRRDGNRSGPTVVIPILNFVGPTQKVRRVLKWEGILIDPIGAIIAVVVFGSFDNGTGGEFDIGELFLSLRVGGLIGRPAPRS